MTTPSEINTLNTQALVVCDFQKTIMGMAGEAATAALGKTKRAIDIARDNGQLVVYVTIGHLEGNHDIDPNNVFFSRVPAGFGPGDPGAALADGLEPAAGEVVVAKRRVSALSGDLDFVLRAHHVTDIALAGVVTHGVVVATAIDAAERDLRVTVLSDACGDPNQAAHDALMEHVFPTFGWVATVDQWAAGTDR